MKTADTFKKHIGLNLISLVAFSILIAGNSYAAGKVKTISITDSDAFVPYAVTIKTGTTVKWVNNDIGPHAIVSVDSFTTAGHKGTNQVILGTASNGGAPATFSMTFNKPGLFVYYCRFHATLNSAKQPIPQNGMESAMSGVVAVVP